MYVQNEGMSQLKNAVVMHELGYDKKLPLKLTENYRNQLTQK